MICKYAIVLAALSLTLPSTRPSTQPPAQQPKATFRTTVELVNVVFTATDRNGKAISGLKAADFQIFEDTRPQQIEYFNDWTHGSETPLTIALLVDTSGSMKTKLEYERQTAAEFFKDVLHQGSDLALIIQFDSEVNLVQDFTEDVSRLTAALDTLRSGNSTALYDAVYLAADEKLKAEIGRKVMVIITDGTDTSSKSTEKEAIEAAQRNDVLIYGIGVRGESHNSFDVLRKFAEGTGGSFFSPQARATEIRRAFQAISQDLRGQYSLAYRSTNQAHDGTYRSLELRCRMPDARIRARKGYYAQKPD